MSDGQESRGEIPTEPGRCECDDLVTLHVINGKGQRAACSSSLCPCKRFVSAEAVDRG